VGAYHEAGHIVVGFRAGYTFEKAWVEADGRGQTTFVTRPPTCPDEAAAYGRMIAAGPVAGELSREVDPSIRHYARRCTQNIDTDTARLMALSGWGNSLLWVEAAEQVLRAHWDQVERVASTH